MFNFGRLCLTTLAVLGDALRTHQDLPDCLYRQLLSADITRTWWGNVEVKYCGTSMVLTTSTSKADAWADVNWWFPNLQQEKLDEEDLAIIKKHLGSYAYSMAVGMLGRGLVPSAPSNFREMWGFKGEGVALVSDVLSFEVKLGDALNKLPSSKAELWRGAWVPPDVLNAISQAFSTGGSVKFPWFQSTTTDKTHSYTFIHSKWQPGFCAPRCEKGGYAFPVHFHIHSCLAKNVTQWNPDEKELILLPNLPFKVKNVTKLANDPVWEMTNKELVAWLRESHMLPTWYVSSWDTFVQDPQRPRGPWPALADLAQKWMWNGPIFLAWYNTRFSNPGYDIAESMNISWSSKMDLSRALSSRFQLGSISEMGRSGQNEVRFFDLVELEDQEPC